MGGDAVFKKTFNTSLAASCQNLTRQETDVASWADNIPWLKLRGFWRTS
jgi:hypothetical protein